MVLMLCCAHRLLAKLYGEINKPNGCFALAGDRTTIRNFMLELPLRKVPGVGQATEKMLAALGCSSCGDVLQHRATVCAVMSPSASDFLIAACVGIGSASKPAPVPKGTDRPTFRFRPALSSTSPPSLHLMLGIEHLLVSLTHTLTIT